LTGNSRFHEQTSSLRAYLSNDIFLDYCWEQGEQSVRRLDSTVIVSFTAGHDRTFSETRGRMPRLPATVKSVELTAASRRKASPLYGGSGLRYYTFEFRYVFATALHYLHAREASGCHRQASRANSKPCLPFNFSARFPLTRKYVESRSRTRVTCTVSSRRGENNVIIARLLPSDEKYHHALMFYDMAAMQIRCFTLQCLKVSSSRMELAHA